MLDFDKTSTTWTWSRFFIGFVWFFFRLLISVRRVKVNASFSNVEERLRFKLFVFVVEGHRRVEQSFQFFHREYWREVGEKEKEKIEKRKMLNFCLFSHLADFGLIHINQNVCKIKFYANGAG